MPPTANYPLATVYGKDGFHEFADKTKGFTTTAVNSGSANVSIDAATAAKLDIIGVTGNFILHLSDVEQIFISSRSGQICTFASGGRAFGQPASTQQDHVSGALFEVVLGASFLRRLTSEVKAIIDDNPNWARIDASNPFTGGIVLKGGTAFKMTLSGIPTVDRALAIPDQDGTFALLQRTQAFTVPQTFSDATSPIITAKIGPASGQQHAIPAVASDTLALLAATQTLLAKTLTSPTINGVVATTGLTMPTFGMGGAKITGLGQATVGTDALAAARSIAAGAGLTGGGDLTTDRTISLDATASITWTGTHVFQDSKFSVVDAADATKVVVINAGGTTGTKTTLTFAQTADRILTAPDFSGTLAVLGTSPIGGTAPGTFSYLNKALYLQADNGSGNNPYGLILLAATNQYDRPAIMHYDETGAMKAFIAYHHRNFVDNTFHTTWEVKTTSTVANDYVTRVSVRADLDEGIVSHTGVGTHSFQNQAGVSFQRTVDLSDLVTVTGPIGQRSHTNALIEKVQFSTPSNDTVYDLSPIGLAGSNNVKARFFLNTASSGFVNFQILKGDGTTKIAIDVDATNGRLSWYDDILFKGTFAHANSADRIYTFQDSAYTVMGTNIAQTVSGNNTFSGTQTFTANPSITKGSPKLSFQDNISTFQATAQIILGQTTGGVRLSIDPAVDGSASTEVRELGFFRNVNTSGTRTLFVSKGDGTSTQTLTLNVATGDLAFLGGATSTSSLSHLLFTNNTAGRNYTFQNSSYTVAGIDIAQTITAVQTIQGATGTSPLLINPSTGLSTDSIYLQFNNRVKFGYDGPSVSAVIDGAFNSKNISLLPSVRVTIGDGKKLQIGTDITLSATSEGQQLINLLSNRDTDRAKFMWTDHLGEDSVMIMAHFKNYTDGALHKKYEIKTTTGTSDALDANMTSASAVLTSNSANFISTDAGRTIIVVGAGVAGADLTAIILTVTNAYTVTLDTAASTTVSNSTFKRIVTGAMTSGSAVLTVATASFIGLDQRRSVIVRGAGPAGADLSTYILSVDSSTQVTLNDAASTTVSNAWTTLSANFITRFNIGFKDNYAAINFAEFGLMHFLQTDTASAAMNFRYSNRTSSSTLGTTTLMGQQNIQIDGSDQTLWDLAEPMSKTASSNVFLRLFRRTTTSGTRSFQLFKGDGSATTTFTVDVSTGATVISGSLTVAALTTTRVPFASTSGLLSDSANFRFNTDSTNFRIALAGGTDTVSPGLDIGLSGTNVGTIRLAGISTASDLRYNNDFVSLTGNPNVQVLFFRGTTTTGSRSFNIYKGDGTSTTAWSLRADTFALTLAEGFNHILGTTTGSKFGTATTQKIGFFNSTPIVQPSGANANLTDSSGGTAGLTIAAAGATYDQTNENTFRASITRALLVFYTALKATSGLGLISN